MRFHSQNQEARERDAQGQQEAASAAFDKQLKWDMRFLALAKTVASWSKDPSTQTGAVIVRPDRTVASLGYNGFPRKSQDALEQYANRDIKLSKIIHCEMNAVLAAREPVRGYTLYTWPFMSCDRCAVHMIQAGIARVVAPGIPEDKLERWKDIMDRARDYFLEAGVELAIYAHE